MTVAELIAERKDRLAAELGRANTAITAKGGTGDADTLHGLTDAIEAIPSGGDLPVLTRPAAAGDILAGKEAVSGSGSKLTGTLHVCSTVAIDTDDQPPYVSGGMAYAPVKSSADYSGGVVSWSEPDAIAANIIAGKTILGVTGTAESGSNPNVFLYEVPTTTNTLTITHHLGIAPTRAACVCMDSDAPASGQKLISGVSNFSGKDGRGIYYNSSGVIDAVNAAFTISGASKTSLTFGSNRNFCGGSTYLFIFA